MAWQNKNFAYSTLNGGVLIGASSMVVTTGANFPATGNFMCVLWDQSYANPSFDSSRELVLCTTRTADTISITRAQEGTSAKAWNSGDKVASIYTAGILDTVVLLDAAQTLTGKTLTTPTIASMINANHDHSAGAGGGVIPAASIGSGTLAHERGGLESDVSAANGLVKISGGATSIVAAPTSTVVGISDSQTLSNKTITYEAWHIFTSSLGSGWVANSVCGYKIDSLSCISLKGQVACASGASTNVYTLPLGYRPEQDLYFPNIRDASGAIYGLTITTSGVLYAGLTTNATIYFDGIKFLL